MIAMLYFIIILISLSLLKLSKSGNLDKINKGIISGRVSLYQEEDHSGITISVFKADIIPKEVIDYRDMYSSIGFKINEKIWFDHRAMKPIDTVFTDVGGKFSFSCLPHGNYIVAYYKEQWGYDYKYGLSLGPNDSILLPDDDLILYPEQEIPQNVNGTYEFESHKCYVAKTTIIFDEHSHIVFHNNSKLLLDRHVKVYINGTIDYPINDERALITSYSGIYECEPSCLVGGGGIVLDFEGNKLSNLSFSYLHNALISSVDNVLYSNLSFWKCILGLSVERRENIEIQNSCFFENEIGISNKSQSICILANNRFIANDVDVENT